MGMPDLDVFLISSQHTTSTLKLLPRTGVYPNNTRKQTYFLFMVSHHFIRARSIWPTRPTCTEQDTTQNNKCCFTKCPLGYGSHIGTVREVNSLIHLLFLINNCSLSWYQHSSALITLRVPKHPHCVLTCRCVNEAKRMPFQLIPIVPYTVDLFRKLQLALIMHAQ